jgi:hypothetical protein
MHTVVFYAVVGDDHRLQFFLKMIEVWILESMNEPQSLKSAPITEPVYVILFVVGDVTVLCDTFVTSKNLRWKGCHSSMWLICDIWVKVTNIKTYACRIHLHWTGLDWTGVFRSSWSFLVC